MKTVGLLFGGFVFLFFPGCSSTFRPDVATSIENKDSVFLERGGLAMNLGPLARSIMTVSVERIVENRRTRSTGTGFVVGMLDGFCHVITAGHGVAGKVIKIEIQSWDVVLPKRVINQYKPQAEQIGDIAALMYKSNPSDCHKLPINIEESPLRLGQPIMAYGNPDLTSWDGSTVNDKTVVVGVVNSVMSSPTYVGSSLYTTTYVTGPGFSGGPVVTVNAQGTPSGLVGVSSYLLTDQTKGGALNPQRSAFTPIKAVNEFLALKKESVEIKHN
jgi:S1-C subfamily serine protease